MDTGDLTQDLWTVMGQERIYPSELRAEDREHLFGRWLAKNPEAVAEMEGWALRLASADRPISVQYLFEKERYEGTAELHPVEYPTWAGDRRSYSINHNDRALFGRWLKKRHPELRVATRKSIFDGRA